MHIQLNLRPRRSLWNFETMRILVFITCILIIAPKIFQMHMNAKFGIVVHIEYLCVCVHFGNPRAEMSFNIFSEVMHLIGSEL